MPDDPDRSHDTDPLADTQSSDERSSADSGNERTTKKRAVHAGDVLGRYELVEDIGEGGMATVFRARDRELRREVAIKVLFPHLARRPEVVRRFHREARAAAGLEHPNILRVYDVGGGEGDDPPFIVMELIRGNSLLAEIEKRGPMLAEVVACIGALLADALAVAHEAGIIHRDVKPANVMVASNGRLLLADFGVARLETEDSLVTKTGSVLGTPAYMSPEQASGDTATAKSDLYSLGATLYQLATGSLPYTGSPARVLSQIAQGALVPAVRKRSEVGPDLSRVIDRLMASDMLARPAKAASVADELRAIASAAGFGEPKDELVAYFANPEQFAQGKLPAIVTAVVAAAERAITDSKLPRAIALADRATALAPEDPAVTALVHKVTEGGKAKGRRRVLALVGAGVLVAGGATFGAMQLLDSSGAAPLDAAIAIDAPAVDAAVPIDSVIVAQVELDAAIGPDAAMPDAGARVRADAGVARVRDAAVLAAIPDANAPVPIDAAVPMTVRVDAGIARGKILVKNDTWCDVTIDGMTHGRISATPITVDAGPHTVVCAQSATTRWSKQVDVPPGKTVTAQGSMLGDIQITLEVDATIDGKAYPAGAVLRLKAGRYDLVIGGSKTFFDLRRPCVIRSSPAAGCF